MNVFIGVFKVQDVNAYVNDVIVAAVVIDVDTER